MPIYGGEKKTRRQFDATKDSERDKLKLTDEEWEKLLVGHMDTAGVPQTSVQSDGTTAISGSVTEANSSTISGQMLAFIEPFDGFFGQRGSSNKNPEAIQIQEERMGTDGAGDVAAASFSSFVAKAAHKFRLLGYGFRGPFGSGGTILAGGALMSTEGASPSGPGYIDVWYEVNELYSADTSPTYAAASAAASRNYVVRIKGRYENA